MNSPEDVLALLTPGATIYVGGSCAEPRGILDALTGMGLDVPDISYIQQPLGAVNQRDLSTLSPGASQRTFFMTPFLQDGLAVGRVEFVPMHMRTIFDHLQGSAIDVAILQGARDRNGELRFGPNVDYVDAVLESAKSIVIELNTSFTAPIGAPRIDPARIDLLVETEAARPTYPLSGSDDTSDKIGELIAGLIHDGDCLQTGIGAVPAAILKNLEDRNDLGFHGGLMDNGIMDLINQGVINGRRKTLDGHQHVLGMALGDDTLLDWLANDAAAENVVFRSADYTHEISVISQIDNFVSVNSAIEIDLMGQVNAEVAGGRQISGTGGSVDFMRSAKASRNGRSIVAMASTARGGSVSRIIPKVSTVTALRTDVDIVVTEFGVADLRHASLASRREQLIAIAHPDFRDQLQAVAE
ncbi:MAG: acetyl-CoA hydrolase/transferase C-terminal domain-containing protein [Gammaproteobacteria bacterium]|jgi:4-hydroxybutyrate CoA-transferase